MWSVSELAFKTMSIPVGFNTVGSIHKKLDIFRCELVRQCIYNRFCSNYIMFGGELARSISSPDISNLGKLSVIWITRPKSETHPFKLVFIISEFNR